MNMVDDEESAAMSTKLSPKQAPLCEECRQNPSKYKCPGCSIRTCCLSCVKAHKEHTACTGKKQYNDVVPLSFFNDNLLLSDYNMLEDVKRVAESGRRFRFKTPPHFRLPFPLKSLRSAASSRRTKLLFFSSGMSKREKNQTYYNYRKKYISWTIEWRFGSTDVVLMDHGIHESRSLVSVLENHLRPGPWKHQLRQFCEQPLDSLKLFIRKSPKGSKSPFQELDLKSSIREQLANLVILEYPVIHVFLPSQKYDFEVIKAATSCKVKDRDRESSITGNDICQTGIKFKEEVVEDDSLDPLVSDLMNTQDADEEFKTYYKKETVIDKELNEGISCSNSSARTIQCSSPELIVDKHVGHNSVEMAIFGNENIHFDQSSADGGKHVITFKNSIEDSPEVALENHKGHTGFSEELEEGEIV